MAAITYEQFESQFIAESGRGGYIGGGEGGGGQGVAFSCKDRPTIARAIIAVISTQPDLEKRFYHGSWRRRAVRWYRDRFEAEHCRESTAAGGEEKAGFGPLTLIFISAAIQIAIKVFFLWWERTHPRPTTEQVWQLKREAMLLAGMEVD